MPSKSATVEDVQFAPPPDAALEMDLLRLTTAGSVDDGKSTLIGRLLYDTKNIFEDQLADIERTSARRGEGYLNLALLTDGLRAEREQNITIDVAYRYFATPKRKFIIADTPGHAQYTRNMVTGASTAELAIVLVDARKGVLPQSRRHGFLASLLQIPHVVVAVNKMDLVGYDQATYSAIVDEYTRFVRKLNIANLTFIPISALHGDNVVEKSDKMDWYDGGTILYHLETVNVGVTRNMVDFRFPVQSVIRPHQDFRGFAGRVASGTIKPGEEVLVLPSGLKSRIRAIETMAGSQPNAIAGESIVVTLEDEVDVSRGDMLVRKKNIPVASSRFDALLCWMDESPLNPRTSYILQHTSRRTQAFISEVTYRIDVDTLHRDYVETLQLNDIGRVQVTTVQPLCFDPYDRNRITGSFILIDPHTNATVAGGMIRGEVRETPAQDDQGTSPDIVWEGWNIPRTVRETRQRHKAAVLWFTGLPASGKTTIARALEHALFRQGCQTMLLDGDQLRHGLCRDLGFNQADRQENIRRSGEVARLFYEQGTIVLCAFVSPYRRDREWVRSIFPDAFFEVFVDTNLEACIARDPKGLYAKSRDGMLSGLTGIDSVYEPPLAPDVRIDTATTAIDRSVYQLLDVLDRQGIVSSV